jgi:hypothetical protein
MIPGNRWKILLSLTGLALGVAALIALDRYETVEEQYATFADASTGGFGQRGWMPDYVPQSATRIRAAQNLDTNRQWLTFQVPPGDVRRLLAEGTQVPKLPASRAPFWLSWWPDGIEGPDRSSGAIRILLPQTGPEGSKRPVRCVVADPQTGTVHAWTCEARGAA